MATSRASRVSNAERGNTFAEMPAARARSSARAPSELEATATTGRPSSSSAWRFVPSPDTSTPITGPT